LFGGSSRYLPFRAHVRAKFGGERGQVACGSHQSARNLVKSGKGWLAVIGATQGVTNAGTGILQRIRNARLALELSFR